MKKSVKRDYYEQKYTLVPVPNTKTELLLR
jgi:hypothetical protein